MIRKGKLVKNTAIALAIISVFGSTLTSVSAAELIKSSSAITQYVDGTYDINAKLLKEESDEDSMAGGYLESTKIQISNNKIYMIMKFANGSLLKELNPKVNGKDVKGTTTTYSSKDTKTIKFEIGSLNDAIELDVKINPFGNFVIDATCRVKIVSSEIPTLPEDNNDDAVTSPTPSVPSEGEDDKEEIKENEQKLNTVLKHETEDKDSMANKFLNSSKLKTVDNRKYMVLEFNSGDMFTAMKATVSGSEVETKFERDKENNTVIVEFEIGSLKDEILLSFTYNTPMGSMTHGARIQSEISSSDNNESEDKDEVTPPTDSEEDNNTGNDNSNSGSDLNNGSGTNNDSNSNNSSGSDNNSNSNNGSGTNNDSNSNSGSSNSNNTYKNGYYQLKNIVHIDNAVGYQMVRNLLSETTNMEVKNGKTYITLRMSSYSLMKDITMKVNNKTVKFTKNLINNDTVEFVVEVPNLNAKITMGMFVTAMDKTVDFDITFNKESVKFISSNEEPTIPESNGGSANNDGSNSSLSNNSNNNSDEKVENTTVKGKLYTIKNEIISDSATGKQMARKYTSSTTKIEEINGKMYATLTFTGVDLMSNHKIYVNGSLVSHTITASSSTSKSIRFAIPNVNADIKVQAYIIPMNATVTYGVKLLEDTLTFVKDFTVENGRLPQTGSAFGSEMLLVLGGLLTASGALLRRKRK